MASITSKAIDKDHQKTPFTQATRPRSNNPRQVFLKIVLACSVWYGFAFVYNENQVIIHSQVIPTSGDAPATIEGGSNSNNLGNRGISFHSINDTKESEIQNKTTTKLASTDPLLSRPWLKYNRTSISIHNRTIRAFEKQPGVVIVTKIHGPHMVFMLEQSLCLLHFAYNRRPLYDVIVFTTLPLSDLYVRKLEKVVSPASIRVVVDNRGLQEEIAALPTNRRDNFLKACGVKDPVNLTWWSECPGRIAYNWQAEFRSWHIWRHPSLQEYKYMMWMDADAFCTKEWDVDPIQAMIENDLVILFDNWPKGKHQGSDVQQRIQKAFGVRLCKIATKQGRLVSRVANSTRDCRAAGVLNIHGFFHITDLDFYRSDVVQNWAEIWIGDGFLQRRYDDQAAVTVPAVILAPERSWNMRTNAMKMEVCHNSDIDGRKARQVGGFFKYWNDVAQFQLPDAVDKCKISAQN